MNNLYKVIFYIGISFTLLFCKANAQNLADVLLEVKPSIVGVGTFLPSRSPRDIFFGTGFVVGNGQFIVTNAHVVTKKLNYDRREQWTIYSAHKNSPKRIVAEKLAVDLEHDIALLKIKQGRLPSLKLGDGQSVREGKLYAFTGYPIGMVLGLYPVTHRGIISAISPVVIPVLNSRKLDAKLRRRLESPYNVYQLDATAYPGNSGSPLYDINTAEVIGVINKVFVKETKENVLSKPSGITYAVPIVHVKNLLSRKGLK